MIEELGNCTYEAISFYARMSGHLHASEGFIKDRCATELHTLSGLKCSTELPIRDFVARWKLERSNLVGLGNFRVDMAVYVQDVPSDEMHIHSLIEFKLWTDRHAVQNDVSRLRRICLEAKNANQKAREYYPQGYVIVAPQYYQGITSSRKALDDLNRFFPFSFRKDAEITALHGLDQKAFGVGVAVIDVAVDRLPDAPMPVWPESVIEQTRILFKTPHLLQGSTGEIHLRNVDGRMATLSHGDAISNKLISVDEDSGNTVSFDNVEHMLVKGWIIEQY